MAQVYEIDYNFQWFEYERKGKMFGLQEIALEQYMKAKHYDCIFYMPVCEFRWLFQFDNVKRVFKTVEEMPGSLEKNIKTHFCIMSDELAKYVSSYVCCSFKSLF